MRTTRTWTISLPPAMGRLAQEVALQEHRTKSELVREALRFYFAQRGRSRDVSAQERLARVGELTDVYRRHAASRQSTEAELRRSFRGVKRLHERLKHFTA